MKLIKASVGSHQRRDVICNDQLEVIGQRLGGDQNAQPTYHLFNLTKLLRDDHVLCLHLRKRRVHHGCNYRNSRCCDISHPGTRINGLFFLNVRQHTQALG